MQNPLENTPFMHKISRTIVDMDFTNGLKGDDK